MKVISLHADKNILLRKISSTRLTKIYSKPFETTANHSVNSSKPTVSKHKHPSNA